MKLLPKILIFTQYQKIKEREGRGERVGQRREGRRKENLGEGAEEGKRKRKEKEETGSVGKAALNSFLCPALARNMAYLTGSTC